MRLLDVNFGKLQELRNALTERHRFFLFLILLVWYVNLVAELKQIMHVMDFCWNFPAADSDEARDRDPWRIRAVYGEFSNHFSSRDASPTSPYRRSFSELGRNIRKQFATELHDEDVGVCIDHITISHRAACFLMAALRAWILYIMAVAGTAFLINTRSYADLLMNAVALAFVFELPEFFYILMVPLKSKREVEGSEVCRYRTSLPTKGCGRVAISSAFWGLCAFPVVSFLVVHMDKLANSAAPARRRATAASGRTSWAARGGTGSGGPSWSP